MANRDPAAAGTAAARTDAANIAAIDRIEAIADDVATARERLRREIEREKARGELEDRGMMHLEATKEKLDEAYHDACCALATL